jgi:hypothetical protein
MRKASWLPGPDSNWLGSLGERGEPSEPATLRVCGGPIGEMIEIAMGPPDEPADSSFSNSLRS